MYKLNTIHSHTTIYHYANAGMPECWNARMPESQKARKHTKKLLAHYHIAGLPGLGLLDCPHHIVATFVVGVNHHGKQKKKLLSFFV